MSRDVVDDAMLSNSSSGGGSQSAFDTFLGPEMEDLQQLLVTMATGKGIETRSRKQ